MSNIIKRCKAKKHIFKPFIKQDTPPHLYDQYKTQQALLEQAIRSGRSYEYILELSRDLDVTVKEMM